MKVLLVSDVHLSNYFESNEFSVFLRNICTSESIERIIFLGDIFDFIFLYHGKYFSPNFIPFYKAIWELEENGILVDFFSGNHDIWVSEVFKEHFDVSVHPEPFKVLEIDGKRILFSHGDRVVNTRGYRVLQMVLRAKGSIFVFGLLPPWLGDKIAFLLSHLSRKANCTPNYEFISKLKNCLAHIAAENGCESVFCGHTHIAEVSSVNGVVYGNPGSWMQDGSYIIIDNGNTVLQNKFSHKMA